VMARLYYDRSDSKIGYPIGEPVASAFSRRFNAASCGARKCN